MHYVWNQPQFLILKAQIYFGCLSLCIYVRVYSEPSSVIHIKFEKRRNNVKCIYHMGKCDLVTYMGKPFCVCTNLTGHYQYWDCHFTSALLQRTHLGQATLAALSVRDVWVRSQSSSFYPSPSTFYSWLSSFCFAQTGEVGLSKASSCVLGGQVKEQRWRQRDALQELSMHFTCTVTARQAGEPEQPGPGQASIIEDT